MKLLEESICSHNRAACAKKWPGEEAGRIERLAATQMRRRTAAAFSILLFRNHPAAQWRGSARRRKAQRLWRCRKHYIRHQSPSVSMA